MTNTRTQTPSSTHATTHEQDWLFNYIYKAQSFSQSSFHVEEVYRFTIREGVNSNSNSSSSNHHQHYDNNGTTATTSITSINSNEVGVQIMEAVNGCDH